MAEQNKIIYTSTVVDQSKFTNVVGEDKTLLSLKTEVQNTVKVYVKFEKDNQSGGLSIVEKYYLAQDGTGKITDE